MWHRIRLNPSAAVDYRFPKNCRKSLRSLKYQHLHPFSQKGMLTRECESSRLEHIDVTANRPLSKLDRPGKLDHPEGNSGFQFRPSKQVPDFENDIQQSSLSRLPGARQRTNFSGTESSGFTLRVAHPPPPRRFYLPPNSRNRLIFRKRRFFAEKMETWEFWLVCPDSGGYLKPLSTDIAGFSSYLGNAAFHGTSIIVCNKSFTGRCDLQQGSHRSNHSQRVL